MVRTKNERLSKAVSYALRHAPWIYELELDDEGWAPIAALLDGLRAEPEFASVTRDDLARMIDQSEKKRHEIAGDRVRALYGHSSPVKLRKHPATPPPVLYHGTARTALAPIQARGLQPMGRQYVHLSLDEATAFQVGRRKGHDVVLLRIRAREASEAGVIFYAGNEQVWLADAVGPAWIDLST